MKGKRITLAVGVCVLIFATTGCGGKREVMPVATPGPTKAYAPEETGKVDRYVVIRGDTLWDISGKSDIYNDHFQWPLVYKANRDQIEDPDIIEIGQDLAISREFSPEEVRSAIKNAKKTPEYVPHSKPRKRLPVEY